MIMRFRPDKDETAPFTWSERAFIDAVLSGDRERSLAAARALPSKRSILSAASGQSLIFAACAMMLRAGGSRADEVARLFPSEPPATIHDMAAKTAKEFGIVCLGFATRCIHDDDLLGAETWVVMFSLLPQQEDLRPCAARVCDLLVSAVAAAERPLATMHPNLSNDLSAQQPERAVMLATLGRQRACLGMAARMAANVLRNGHESLARMIAESALRLGDWPTVRALSALPPALVSDAKRLCGITPSPERDVSRGKGCL